jgi:type I restriction enzyme S subunit
VSFRTVTIADIAAPDKRSIAIGPFGSSLKAELYVPAGVPVVRGQNIKEGGQLDESDLVFVQPETAARFPACLLNEGDLVFPHRGAIGRVGIVGKRQMLLSSSMMKLTVDPLKVDPRFVFYYFRGPGKNELLMRASTVGTPGIGQPLTSLRGISIQIPELDQQRAIAAVLGALDDKIAANTKLAATSMCLAETYFRRTMHLATDERALGEILSLEYGKSLPTSSRVTGPIDVYGSGGITGSHNEALCPDPGVVVGRKGTAGAVHWSHRPFFPIDTTFYVATRHDAVSQVFCYFLLRTLGLDEMNNDSAVPGLNRNQAHASRIMLPSEAALVEFTELVTKLFSTAAQIERENSTLVLNRDALLPQLMSGKLRVKNAGKVLENAGV